MFFSREEDKLHRAQGYLRRICDLTSPNLPRLDEGRSDHRHNRTIPVLLAPWQRGAPALDETTTALTKDLCDRGLSAVLAQPFRADDVVVGFWLPDVQSADPWFLRGIARQNVPIGGGFWALGIEVAEVLPVCAGSEVSRLLPLVPRLLPPRAMQAEPHATPAHP